MDIAFYLPCLHERLPVFGESSVCGRRPTDTEDDVGSLCGTPGASSLIAGIIDGCCHSSRGLTQTTVMEVCGIDIYAEFMRIVGDLMRMVKVEF